MSEPFLGEIRMFGGNFAPRGWAFCNGQVLSIAQNTALFSLLGTTYGGNGQTTFALPDLRGRAPIHVGQGFTLGQKGGQEFHTLLMSEMPAHNHFVIGTTAAANTNNTSSNLLAQSPGTPYRQLTNPVALNPANVTNVGGSQPHENRQPFLVVGMIIALVGIFPSQN